MARGPHLTEEHIALVLAAAKSATEILQSHGIPSAIFGSLASHLYGAPRLPKDVDILTIPPAGFSEHSGDLLQEELKALIARSRPRDFYLKDAKNPGDTYKILIFRPSPSINYPARSQEEIIKRADPECKIDILTPGTMHLPQLETSYIHWVAEIPLVPFSLLLVQKLQGWDDNRNAEEPFRRYRQHKDAKDVKALLGLKEFVNVLIQTGRDGWTNTELFSEEFQQLTKERVEGFARVFASSAKQWRSLGFQLP
ncbi:hypothetical protein M413DRAFT_126473 [Hebeloma cylindrosporum]|uniref:Uncharacterized protein n=1 Tax=Hebeloma cylindrosporum TaxID=76867 RepID=A0A0C3CER8_HEBCY|nr:hypothetical protein M413DRAFT_126473 [Hebeloma cylindrosporum h7]